MTLFSSLSRFRFSTIMLSICKQVTAPSPVVLWSRNRIWRLLAAKIVIVRQHLFDDVAVADLGTHDFQAGLPHRQFQTQILITVATIPELLSVPLRCKSNAQIARI